MKSTRIRFSEEEARSLAKEYYNRYYVLDFEKEKHRRMYNESMDVWQEGIRDVHIDSLLSFHGSEAYQDRRVIIEGLELNCSAFAQIPDGTVKGVYLYIITSGECRCDRNAPMAQQLYADLWGTAYVDAGRDLLEKKIFMQVEKGLPDHAGERLYLSGSFGPGFRGMDLSESKKINTILDGSRIGVSVLDNGIMLPIKTCSGLYLVVDDLACLPSDECESCVGNMQGCNFCTIRIKSM